MSMGLIQGSSVDITLGLHQKLRTEYQVLKAKKELTGFEQRRLAQVVDELTATEDKLNHKLVCHNGEPFWGYEPVFA